MREPVRTARVGLLVVLALGATYAVWRFVDERAGGRAGYGVWAVFEDAQGLVPKSRVLVAGIQVGHIRDIRLWGRRARVDIHIDEGVPLRRDATVTRRTASLLGDAVLVIDPGDPREPLVGDGAQIRALEGTPSTDAILEGVADVTRSVQAVARQMERSFGTDEAGERMQAALRDLSEALAAINRTIQQNEEVIARTLANVERTTGAAGPALLAILEDVRAVTRDVRRIVEANREDWARAGGEVDETVASIRRASERLEQVLADVGEITGRTARGEGTLGRLTSDEGLADEVERVAESVGDVVEPLARLQTIVGLRSEYNFLSDTLKSYVSLRIAPREDRYYLLELINDPRGLTRFTQTVVRRSPPAEGEPPVQTETRVETTDAFRFSLMFAKRIHFATFRFGILESTGGVGMDVHLLDDDLELSLDAFAFGEQQYPRLRARLAYRLLERLWLLGGLDDVLNQRDSLAAPASNDFFLGAMLRFDDEDLRAILPFVGGSVPSGG
ncbi:MAG: MlaD family protein [Myxococcota bacterium]|nr:MlaD family protein [Myxococcota bacterium]MDW8363472.1 MlaD family protein [Myxococcales bacterium]